MPGRILIVDQNPDARRAMETTLADAYYDVLEAERGEDALRLARIEEPDLILLDAAIEGKGGFETCRRLKTDESTAHIPIVMLSSRPDRADCVRGLESGADDFLIRPCSDTALLSRVSGLTRMKMMIDELRQRAATARGLGFDGIGRSDTDLDLSAARVLIVGRDDALTTIVADHVRDALGISLEQASGEAAVRSLAALEDMDAFIVGADLADGEPLRIASLIRGRPLTRQAALIMLVRAGDPSTPLTAMDMGVTDFLILPPDPAELVARLRVQLKRKYYSDQLRKSVQDSMELAVTDPLTDLYNRRYSTAHLESMIARSRSENHALAAMVLDLDNFKDVNDRFGHRVGDMVLVEFARRLTEGLRNVDLVSRIGGEEFLAVMPDIPPEMAQRVAERVRHAVENPGFEIGEGRDPLNLTASIGLALHRPGETGSALVARADEAAYASKRGGRNRVTLSAA